MKGGGKIEPRRYLWEVWSFRWQPPHPFTFLEHFENHVFIGSFPQKKILVAFEYVVYKLALFGIAYKFFLPSIRYRKNSKNTQKWLTNTFLIIKKITFTGILESVQGNSFG